MSKQISRSELDALLSRAPRRLHDIDLRAVNLRGVDFSSARLEGVNLSGQDLSGVSFRGATIKESTFDGAKLDGADFTGASLGEGFVGLSMRGAVLRGAAANEANLCECDLREIDFTGAALEYAAMDTSDLRSAIFHDANLRGASFEEADASNADFTGAEVEGVRWKRAKRDGVVGLGEQKPSPKRKSTSARKRFERTSSLGGPILAIAAENAPLWTGNQGEDYERACDSREGRVTVAGWIETSSVTVGRSRALVLHGAVETGFVGISGGVVIVRGGTFADAEAAERAVREACEDERGWKSHAHLLTLATGKIWIFDSVVQGGTSRDAMDAEHPVLEALLSPGSYAVDAKGSSDDSGPIAFVRLARAKPEKVAKKPAKKGSKVAKKESKKKSSTKKKAPASRR